MDWEVKEHRDGRSPDRGKRERATTNDGSTNQAKIAKRKETLEKWLEQKLLAKREAEEKDCELTIFAKCEN